MLSVVVDDHDMGVTHIIRGDDHLTNARVSQFPMRLAGKCRSLPMYRSFMAAMAPSLNDTASLRVDAYRDMGLLPEAMRNYLARLGWSHGDDEIFTTEQLIGWFGLEALAKVSCAL